MFGQRDHDLLYFCDESCHVTHDWMAVGGLGIRRELVAAVSNRVRAIKITHDRTGSELKWSNANSYGGRAHKDMIDLLFELIGRRQVQFHVRFAPFGEYDHRQSGPRQRTDTVAKMYYQLILHRAIRHNWRTDKLFIIPDDGECTCELAKQIPALMTHEAHFFSQVYHNTCLDSITPRSSAREPMLQLLDVTLGALSAVCNGRLSGGSTNVKRRLAEYALQKTGVRDIAFPFPIGPKHFSIWNVKPKARVIAAPAASLVGGLS